MIDAALLTRAGISAAAEWARPLTDACARFEISSDDRIAMFLAQCAHESNGLRILVEDLRYSAAGLVRTWPTRFSAEQAAAYAGNPVRIANRVYSFRMGNGAEESGDGWRYRGRGLLQITGRDGYARCGKALGLELLGDPDQLLELGTAAASAAWYWKSNGCNELADAGQFAAITRRINGGLIGQDDREGWLGRINRAMQLGG